MAKKKLIEEKQGYVGELSCNPVAYIDRETTTQQPPTPLLLVPIYFLNVQKNRKNIYINVHIYIQL